ncbi:hypothetical protein TrST_g6672 [Triparma strigata]|uniref:Uncharacterized protein n=1 Tax=Triparma strigata TaxID=1606541 RepID=A0A9W7EXC5_9STRA|nr:hypothetical protein TrST_g6672 [Triparma strigata]
MPPKKRAAPVPIARTPLETYQDLIAKVRKSLSSLMTNLETYPGRPPASIPAEGIAAWEDQASHSAALIFHDSILTICKNLLNLRTYLNTPDLKPLLNTPIPCDYLDLLDHGSNLGFGVNPDIYCRELVRRVLLFSEGLEERRKGWEVVCERISNIKPEASESSEEEEKVQESKEPQEKRDPVTYLQDVIDNLCLSFYYSLEGSREKASMGIAMGAKRDEERVRDLVENKKKEEGEEVKEDKDESWIDEAVENVQSRFEKVTKGLKMVENELTDDMESVLSDINSIESSRSKIKEEIAALKAEGEVLLKRIEEKSEEEWKAAKRVKRNDIKSEYVVN